MFQQETEMNQNFSNKSSLKNFKKIILNDTIFHINLKRIF